MSNTGIEIAAAGKSNRLRDYITELGYPEGFPKLLLPTGNPDGETLLGRVLRQALDAPVTGQVTVHTSQENDAFMQDESDVAPLLSLEQVSTTYKKHCNSFGPFLPKLLQEQARVLGSSGDFYADFSWGEVLTDHDSNKYPVTFVVGQTVEVDKGAVFEVRDNGRITDFARVERTHEKDLVNIGVYVFEPTQKVIETLSQLVSHRQMAREEEIVSALVEKGLMGAHVLTKPAYNVNSSETYRALLDYTHSSQPATH